MKRYYVCYCPWVRGAIKDGTEKEISANFCHCSAGFTKKYWDYVFGQPVTVQPVETALTGALHCKFAVQIPKEYQK
jgi:predicted hydrocarbon binding protein